MDDFLKRRRFVQKAVAGAAGVLWSRSLIATPQCFEATEPNIEGPFYKPGAPDREALAEPGMPGTRLILTGRIVNTECAPLRGAVLDVWQANHEGQYDNSGFTLRGRFHADKSGLYRIETIVPKRYRIGGDRQFRPAHIHLKVSAPGCPLLTTQLYFEGDPYNRVDPDFRRSLALAPKDVTAGKAASFDFVLKTA